MYSSSSSSSSLPTPLPGMHYASFTTKSDSCRLAYQTSLLPSSSSSSYSPPPPPMKTPRPKICLLPIHGFSGSSFYFTRNVSSLLSASSPQNHVVIVVAPDLRGHGASSKKGGDYRVARLAADLKELVDHVRGQQQQWASAAAAGEGEEEEEEEKMKIIPIGCSIGAAVLWTYVELFGSGDFDGFVFVDQGPLQDRRVIHDGRDDDDDWDERYANKGCFDEETLRGMQDAWAGNGEARREAEKGLVGGCLGYLYSPPPPPSDEEEEEEETKRREKEKEKEEEDMRFFTSISATCDGVWLGKLMEDHTRYDHREAIEFGVDKPSLVMAGGKSGCFPLEGMKETVRRIEKGKGGAGMAEWSVFEGSGHWLYYEDPERFGREVLEFVERRVV